MVFFTERGCEQLQPYFSAWKDTTGITIEDIILYAMKNPTDIHGKNGNRTAQILYKRYHIILEQEDSSLDLSSITNPHEKCFKRAWMKIRRKEKDALDLFDTMKREKIDKEQKSAWCGCFWKQRTRFTPVNNNPGSKTKTRTSLVHLIESSNPSYLSRVLGGLGIYGFYSGTRTHEIFKKRDSDPKKCFAIDTRSNQPSDVLAKDIFASIKTTLTIPM